LAGGWEAVYGRRRSAYRSGVSRKWSALQRLGAPAVVDVTAGDDGARGLPSLFTLFRARLAGRHQAAGFAHRHRAFHEAAAPALAAAGHLRVSLLQLDDEPVAFAYGVGGARGTSSYVLGHATALTHYSPGQLLLIRSLEGACARGEAEYDLSIGDE